MTLTVSLISLHQDDEQEPSQSDCQTWCDRLCQLSNISNRIPELAKEVCIKFVSSDEIQTLNKTYRQKNSPTNVLSFPNDIDEYQQSIGDIAICPEIIIKEAEAANISVLSHYAHMVIHGILHCLGYDHILDEDAKIMENIEISALANLHIANPYKDHTPNE